MLPVPAPLVQQHCSYPQSTAGTINAFPDRAILCGQPFFLRGAAIGLQGLRSRRPWYATIAYN